MNCEKECNKCNNIKNEEELNECEPVMEYGEEAYYRLLHEYQNLANENEKLKKALVNIVLKL